MNYSRCTTVSTLLVEKFSNGRTASDHCGAQDSHKRKAQWQS